MNGAESALGPEYTVHRPDLRAAGIDASDFSVLCAAGVAFTEACGFAPRVAGPAPGAKLRGLRTAAYAGAGVIALCALLLAASFPVAAHMAVGWTAAYKEQYRQILSQTPELRALMVRNDSLAQTVILSHETEARKTRWTTMLETLGRLRPDGLYFDMIGTDGAQATGITGVALSGWAQNESLVTGFIGSLAKSGPYSDISLSSLERDEQKKITTFRITCTFRLSGGSPQK